MLVELEFKKDVIDTFSSTDSKLVAGTLERVQLRENGGVMVTVSGKTMYVYESFRGKSMLESVTYQEGTGMNPASFGSCTTVANMADGESMYRFFKKLLFNGTTE